MIIELLLVNEELEPTFPAFVMAHSRCLGRHSVGAQRSLPNNSARQKSWGFIATLDKNPCVRPGHGGARGSHAPTQVILLSNTWNSLFTAHITLSFQ